MSHPLGPPRGDVLDPDRPYKPLDVGDGAVAASVAADGRLVAVCAYHPEHGHVTLGGAARFADEHRHDPDRVRAYRADLADRDAPGFGLAPPGRWRVATGLDALT